MAGKRPMTADDLVAHAVGLVDRRIGHRRVLYEAGTITIAQLNWHVALERNLEAAARAYGGPIVQPDMVPPEILA